MRLMPLHSLAIVALVGTGNALGAEDIAAAVNACRAEADDARRLACYDRAVGRATGNALAPRRPRPPPRPQLRLRLRRRLRRPRQRNPRTVSAASGSWPTKKTRSGPRPRAPWANSRRRSSASKSAWTAS